MRLRVRVISSQSVPKWKSCFIMENKGNNLTNQNNKIAGLCVRVCAYMCAGLNFFSREPNCIFKSYLKVLCIETSTSLGSLQKYEGAEGKFKGAHGSRHMLILSPGVCVCGSRTISPRTISPGQYPPGQYPPRTKSPRTISPRSNIPPDNIPPDNIPPG